jgi:TatD DNase family protein
MSNNLGHEVYDAHCHLSDESCKLTTNIVTPQAHRAVAAISSHDWSKLATYRQINPNARIGFGVHPWNVERDLPVDKLEVQLRAQIEQQQPDFIGETGLDALKGNLNLQLEYLKIHLQLAQDFNLPIILHCVRAHNQLLEFLGEFPKLRGMIHAYNANFETAKQYRRKNMQLGIGGIILTTNSQLAKSSAHLPLEQLLIESDAPYKPMTDKQTSNSNDCLTYALELAMLQQKNPTEIISRVNQNWLDLFS